MTQPLPDNPQPSRIDPRLKAFLRKAAAIIATEKGLNANSRLKLETLAEHEKLPIELFDDALIRLQQSPAAAANLNHYEKAFARFLDGEFEKISGGIVSPKIEQEAIRLAKQKYDINATSAQQLIAARATAAGIDLISEADAFQFAHRGIVDQVGSGLEISDEQTTQLVKFGEKWGLEEVQVMQIANRRTYQNRRVKRGKIIKPVVALTIFTGIVSGIGLLGYSNGWFNFGSTTPFNDPAISNPGAILPTAIVNSTRFSDADFQSIQILTGSDSESQTIVADVFNSDRDAQAKAYRRLAGWCMQPATASSTTGQELISLLYYHDPNQESAAEAVNELVHQLTLDRASLFSVAELREAYRANLVLASILFSPQGSATDEEQRRAYIAESIDREIGVGLNDNPSERAYRAQSESAIATEQWNRLMQSAWSSPTQASVVLQPLLELTQGKLDQEILLEYRDDAIASILRTDTARWRVLESEIQASISSCNEARLSEWTSIFQSSTDEGFRRLIGKVLVSRLEITAKSSRVQDIAVAIDSFVLRKRNQTLMPAISRNQAIDAYVQETINSIPPGLAQAAPDQIARLALAVNVQWAFCATLENATHIDESSFAVFDRLFSTPTPQLKEEILLPIDRRNPNSAKRSSATASDLRRFEAGIERLSNSSENTASQRLLALKQLQQVAHRFDSISYDNARQMALYLTAQHKRDDLLEIEKIVDSFSHWPNVLVAIADVVQASDVEADQVLTIVRWLANRDFEFKSDVAWKPWLQRQIMVSVAERLDTQINLDPDNRHSDWRRLRIYLLDTYQERLAISQKQSFVEGSYDLPHEFVAKIIETTNQRTTLADGSPNPRNKTTAKALELIKTSSSNSLDKTAICNELLADLLTNELAKARPRKHLLGGDRLQASELELLRALNQRRKSLVQELCKEGQ
ncbi:MAG: hypothetical protein ACI87E_003834 [Mariniblastus sp.]